MLREKGEIISTNIIDEFDNKVASKGNRHENITPVFY